MEGREQGWEGRLFGEEALRVGSSERGVKSQFQSSWWSSLLRRGDQGGSEGPALE